MAKNNPILDGILAGSAVSAVSGKADSNKGSSAFLVGALAAYRSAKQNEELDREDRSLRRHHAALASQSQEMHSRLSEIEARQIQADQAQAQQQRFVSSIRTYIVEAEEWIENGASASINPWEFATHWVFLQAIRRGINNFDIGLDEQRAIAKINSALTALWRQVTPSPARLIACTVGLARSVADWSVLATRSGHEVRMHELRAASKKYVLRRKRARRLGLLDDSTDMPGLTPRPAVAEFVVSCSGFYQELEVLHTVSESGVAPFSKTLVKKLHDEIKRSKSEPPQSVVANDPALAKGGWVFGLAVDPGQYVEKGGLVAAISLKGSGLDCIEVHAPQSGHIEKICRQEGEEVRNGDVIARFISVNYEGDEARQDEAGSAETEVVQEKDPPRKYWKATLGFAAVALLSAITAFATSGHWVPSTILFFSAICLIPYSVAAVLLSLRAAISDRT